jgi:hypothetical protein
MYIENEAAAEIGCFRCLYEYQVGKCDKYYWVLVKQPVVDDRHEQIGMRTEQIATEIYFKEISHADPYNVRFIHYYPSKDIPNNLYPDEYAEMMIGLSFSKRSLFQWVFGKRGVFNGYTDSHRALKPPFDDAVSFFSDRGISV